MHLKRECTLSQGESVDSLLLENKSKQPLWSWLYSETPILALLQTGRKKMQIQLLSKTCWILHLFMKPYFWVLINCLYNDNFMLVYLSFMQNLFISKVRGNCASTVPVKWFSACLESPPGVDHNGWVYPASNCGYLCTSHSHHLHSELSLLQFQIITSCPNQHDRELFLLCTTFCILQDSHISSSNFPLPEQLFFLSLVF